MSSDSPHVSQEKRTPIAGKADLFWLLFLWFGHAATKLVPRRFDRRFVKLLAALMLSLRSGSFRSLARRIQATLGLTQYADAERISRDHHRMTVEMRWGRLRSVSGKGWHPEIELQGEEHLRAAVERGRGVVLWVMSFCSTPVVFQGLWRAGMPVVHLSAANHGAPSASRVGLRWATPLYLRAETPYLAERVVIPLDQSLGYLRTLITRLEANACISITGKGNARNHVSAKLFGLDVEFAPGAPSLAWRSGATLLTCYAVRSATLKYCVNIDPPIGTDRRLPRKEFVDHAVSEFAVRLERRIREHPADWRGWRRHPFGGG